MDIAALIVVALLYVCTVGSMSITPRRSKLSTFELQRRKKEAAINLERKRSTYYADVTGLLRLIALMSVAVSAPLVVMLLGWLWGLLVVIAGVTAAVTVARSPMLQRSVQRVYDRYEQRLFVLIERYRPIVAMFARRDDGTHGLRLGSRQELDVVIRDATAILSKDERQLLRRGLEMSDVTVADIMTPYDEVSVVRIDDVVGPLLLDELHQTGHEQFPVVDDTSDQVRGMLYIGNLLQLHDKDTHRAESLMKPVEYVESTQTIEQLLMVFSETGHLMLVVCDGQQRPVGVVTLASAVSVTFGRTPIRRKNQKV